MGSKVKTILLTILILFSIDIITLILLTKYSSMFSWNSGDKKVSSALSLISGSETRRGSIAGIWGINPFNRVRDIVRNRVQGQTLKSKKLSGNPPKITENPSNNHLFQGYFCFLSTPYSGRMLWVITLYYLHGKI